MDDALKTNAMLAGLMTSIKAAGKTNPNLVKRFDLTCRLVRSDFIMTQDPETLYEDSDRAVANLN